MTEREEVHDSPVDWVNKHIQSYLASGGKQRKGTKPRLLLTTRGRKSGALRRTALYYWLDGDRYYVVASDGGSAKHPAWYLNLSADPAVTLQVGTEIFEARAQTADAAEKARLWAAVAADLPMYDSFQEKTRRDIPVVLFTRV